MFAIANRNIKLFFHNKAGVFFSLLGALIAFLLYLVFLEKNMAASWGQFSGAAALLDNWIMSGTLAVTGITTTWTIAMELVKDRALRKLDDFLLTDVSLFAINMGYFLSASLVGFVMQATMFAVMQIYFMVVHGLAFQAAVLLPLVLTMWVHSLVASGLALLAAQLIQSPIVAERLAIIVGTASGFLVGVYMPVGSFPDFAQTLVKLTPGAYAAAAFRQLLMADSLQGLADQAPTAKVLLGIGLEIGGQLTSLSQNWLILFAVLLLSLILLAGLLLAQKRQTR